MKKNKVDNKEVVHHLISALIESFVFCVVIYFCLTEFNDALVYVLQHVKAEKDAITVAALMFPIMFIVSGIIRCGQLVIAKNKKK